MYNMGASFMNFMFFWRPANCISVVLLNVVFLFVGKIKWWWWWWWWFNLTLDIVKMYMNTKNEVFMLRVSNDGAPLTEQTDTQTDGSDRTGNITTLTLHSPVAIMIHYAIHSCCYCGHYCTVCVFTGQLLCFWCLTSSFTTQRYF